MQDNCKKVCLFIKGRRPKRGSCWEERKRTKSFPMRGGIDLPSKQIIEILQRANKIKIALVTRPGRHSWRFGAELWW